MKLLEAEETPATSLWGVQSQNITLLAFLLILWNSKREGAQGLATSKHYDRLSAGDFLSCKTLDSRVFRIREISGRTKIAFNLVRALPLAESCQGDYE
jgi:hypothetical protein